MRVAVDDKRIFSLTSSLYVYDKSTYELEYQRTFDGSVSYIVVDDKFVYVSRRPNHIDILMKSDGSHIRTLEGHSDTILSLAVDNDYLYSASYDETIRIWKK